MTWIINLITALFSLWQKNKQDQVMNTGVNYQKAAESSDAIKNAEDSQVISGDVDRMSDDEVRNSPNASYRD